MPLLFKELHFCLPRIWAKKVTEGISLLLCDEEPSLSPLPPPLLRFGPVPISPPLPHVVRDNCEIDCPRRMELFCVSAALPNNTPLKINGSPSFLQTKRFRNLPHRHNFNLSSITRGGVSPVSHSLSPPTLEHLKWGNHKADAEYLNHSSSAYRALPPRSPISHRTVPISR